MSAYTLMVAGRRTGKTSFLRLLLDTTLLSPLATHDQLQSVARFVQGSAGFTSHIRALSVNVEVAVADNDPVQTLTLTLIDTPALDYNDDAAAQRTVNDILRHVDQRFSESVEDERKAYPGDHHVHLCIYFLDPNDIVPPSVAVPPAPLVSRTRNNSLSKSEQEPVILEPPVTTNPLLCRPTLPLADIATIRRLSSRVNVLPVVGRADELSNDRLSAVKLAIRRDLAAAGIGFGIFDTEIFTQYGAEVPDIMVPKLSPEQANCFNGHTNGTASTAGSPPSTPLSPALLRLPFALISPDIYSHSDGVNKPALSRHELMLQYAPSNTQLRPLSKIIPGKWVRSYRWGSLDCMDANHCDFLHLRGAIFFHMKTLQKYTREYLLEKFKADYQLQTPALSPSTSRSQRSPTATRLPPLPHGSRPILAIDTAPTQITNRQPSASLSRGVANGENTLPPLVNMPELSPNTATSASSQRLRTKKITVACNFCRSRKLKCDGGKPACSQCFKRNNPCDYTVNHKRRGGKRRKSDDVGSESDGDSGERSGDMEPSLSPQMSSQPHSRRNSNAVDLLKQESNVLPPMNGTISLERPPVLPSISQSADRAYIHELPPIATLPVTPAKQDSSSTLPPLRPPVEMEPQASVARRRTSSAASTKARQNGYGSKIVACNFCRARKTRCDGEHPSCGSCAKRNLPCNYVNDLGNGNPKGRPKAPPMAAPPPSTSVSAGPSVRSSPTSQAPLPLPSLPLSTGLNGYARHVQSNGDLKRDLEAEHLQPAKKMRVTDDLGYRSLAVPPVN
ncbi:hypothetical protein BC835DRAFT_1406060 [Cytidiella melzeri]|nr:hypothetical protein BC835DRAFT_1406060 [Cytidiella melzeri]